MAPPGAIAHSRALLCPRASVLSFSSSVAPLSPLGLGVLGRGSVRSSMYFYVVTDAGPASHRVRLWQGGPASTYCRIRPRCAVVRSSTLVVVGYLFSSSTWPRSPWTFQAPLALRGSRGDGNGGRFVRSPCLPLRRGLRLCALYQMLSLCSLYSNNPLSSRPQPLGSVGDDTPCEDTREDFGLFV